MFPLCENRQPKSFPDVRTNAIASVFVMCEQDGMVTPPGTQELADKAGISKGYASDILNGKRPNLGRPLAIHIYRATGWKHPCIADLTEDQMSVFEQVDPWTSPREAA
jgi:transcriptional regulator with XRE-family HTH domain